jgi:hypothetical protein
MTKKRLSATAYERNWVATPAARPNRNWVATPAARPNRKKKTRKKVTGKGSRLQAMTTPG